MVKPSESASAADDFENDPSISESPITGFAQNRNSADRRTVSQTSSPDAGSPISYNESFTVDYNPDPELQADNGDGATYFSPGDQSSRPNYLPKTEESGLQQPQERYRRQPAINPIEVAKAPVSVVAIAGAIVVIIGFTLDSIWLTLAGSIVAFVVSLRLLTPTCQEALSDLTQQQRALFVAIPSLLLGMIGLVYTSGIGRLIARWGSGLRWDIISALGDFLGAIGQIFIAIIAVYVAWRQYIISRDLTVQQNLITQQQTIDSYFQGISELVLDDEGLLEDWPQERVIAEARTAAILSSVDADGKAKVLRFLSRSKLLTPLARDQRLGRPILDGLGGYAEDRARGTRVIDLGVMLAASCLADTDLRWLDLSESNLIRADLKGCDLVRTNFSRAILCDANLTDTDIMGVRFFYGDIQTATPRTRQDQPNYTTGEFTGTVIEGADFTNVQRLSEVQRCYCCTWGGSKTRETVPGGCEDLPNQLGR
ncbi:pentapeptide repeat-containing protein [Leptolyngbya sp. BC1307]|uniref:pentapeptide repeat-containing protein n=1 Tax=Leptolyngbya sp. BC1307 TaxID=2029589 RepID=UPI000EFD83DA